MATTANSLSSEPRGSAAGHEVACQACGGVGSTSIPDPPSRGGFSVRRCARCGVGITTPFPSAGEIEALYPPTHYGSGGPRYRPAIERVARWFRERRAAWITRRHAPGAVLEVGCGHGYMLAGLRDRGWRVQGVELHEHSARYGRDLLGLPIAVGDFTTLGLPGASFDVVVFWHSFEHLGEPLAALREAARLVKPGGLVIIAVPNMGSWQARWAGARWFHWEIPRHLYHYDVPSLETLLGRAHLQVTYVSHANWEQNPFGWMQSILNRLGFPSNQFFTGLWAVPDGGESGRPIVQRILAGPVLAAGFVLAAMETLCRRGGTITLVARRPPH